MCAVAAVRKIGSLARSNIHWQVASLCLSTYLRVLILEGEEEVEEGLGVKGYLLPLT